MPPGRGGFGEFEIVLRVDLPGTTGCGGSGAGASTAISSVSSNTSASGSGGRISSGVVASSRPFSSASISSWLLLAAGAGGGGAGGGAGFGAGAGAFAAAGGGAGAAGGGASFIAALRWRRSGGLLRLCRGGSGSGFFGSRRLGFVVGNDATDRRQNLLHRGFLDLCRLRHLRLHIINALACVLHQAREDLPIPDMQAGIFIAQA